MSEQAEGGRSDLWRCLQTLSQEEGVWRPNLVELLKGDLRTLQQLWRINIQGADDDVRKAVSASLHALIVQLKPRDARQQLSLQQREKQYRHGVSVAFNIFNYPELRSTKLQERRSWLARKERGIYRIAVTTSQRELNHAIDQIEKILTSSDYRPAKDLSENTIEPSGACFMASNAGLQATAGGIATPATAEGAPTVGQGARSISLTGLPVSGGEVSAPRRWFKRRLLLIIASMIVVTSLAVGLATFFNDRDGVVADNTILRSTIIPDAPMTNLTTAFPVELREKAREHARRLSDNIKRIDLTDAFLEQLDDGAYAAGPSALIRIELEGLVDGEVTVTNVRLDGFKRDPLPLDTLISMSLGGADRPREMHFSLDQSAPVAMYEAPYVDQPVEEFRLVERIGIPKGGKETLLLTFYAQTAAATFNIAIDYEYQGIVYTQVLHRTKDGRPFRMAPVVCDIEPDRGLLLGVQQEELDRVRTLRYGQVHSLDVGTGGQGEYSLEPMDPDVFAKRCY